jgi:murein DD-endopeptidase MepM/ murein hydrolase activator NlpD
MLTAICFPRVTRTRLVLTGLMACLVCFPAGASVAKSRHSASAGRSSVPRSQDATYTRGQGSTRSRLSSLVLPFPRADVTSQFGLRFNPILKAHIFHRGVDFGAPMGTPIRAAQAGIVEVTRESPGAGLYVRVSHGDGVETCYEHLSRLAPDLHRGSYVRKGEVIGAVGKTGWATGPNLHYEVVVNGVQIDPLNPGSAMAPIRVAQLR